MITLAIDKPIILEYLQNLETQQAEELAKAWSTVQFQDNVKKSREFIQRYTDFINKPSPQKAHHLTSELRSITTLFIPINYDLQVVPSGYPELTDVLAQIPKQRQWARM